MKTTWKWGPVARYHISAAEEWLTKMAARGLLFRKFWGPFAQFEVAEPRPGRRYRLAVDPDYCKRPPEPMAELYEQAGWHFAAPIWGRSFFVFWSDDPLAIEPYTDEESRAESLAQVVRICRTAMGNSCWVLAYVLLSFYVYFCDSPLKFFTRSWFYPIMVLVGLVFFVSALKDLFSVLRMRRWLEQGQPLRTFAPPRGMLVIQSVDWALRLSLLLLLAVLVPITFLGLDSPLVPLDQAPPELELLLLSDIEGPGYHPDDFEWFHLPEGWHADYSQDGFAHNNYYQRFLGFLSPTRHVTDQSGTAADGTRVQLDIQRYDLMFARQAGDALNELALGAPFQECSVPGADRFLASETGDTVCASLGRRVIQVTYSGGQDFTEYYDEIVEMLRAEK